LRKLNRDYVLRVAAFLFALSASVSLFNHLCGLMSASQLPPGLFSALHYNALAHGWSADSLTPDEALLYPFISFTAHVFNLDPLTALKLIPTFLLSTLPLLAYFLSLTVTGSRLVGVAAAWMLTFMPAVATSLIVGNYSLILGLLLFTAYLSFLVRCLKRGSRGALCLALSASTLTLPLLFLLTLGTSPQIQGQVFGVNSAVWAENLWLSVIIMVGVAIGAYALLKKVKLVVLPVLLVSVIVAVALVFIPALNPLYVLSTPILALLAASPLLWLRGSCLVHEVNAVGHSSVVEVVIDLPKLAAVLLVAFLTISTVSVGYSALASIYDEHSVSRYFTDEEISSALKWMGENVRGEEVLSSKPVVAAWLEALSGRRFVGLGGLDEALVSETIESTSFRILTPSLLVDEWEPFSASKAPSISYYNGRRYEPIAYIDDSLVRARLIKDGKEWIESPYRSAYRGYRWQSDAQPEVILVQRFETHGLFFEKTIRVSTSKPRVNVEYRVDQKANVELVGLELPVRVEPWKETRIFGTTNDEVRLIIDGVETKIYFLGDVVNTVCEEYDEGHVMVKAEFRAAGGAVEAGAVVSIKSGERSQMPLWLAYTPELIKNHNIEYVVAEAGTMGFLDRSLVDPVESLIIKDSFNRILFDALGDRLVEIPSSGRVRFDESPVDGVRLIGYETERLRVNKTLTQSEHSIEVRYATVPIKTSSSLVSMNLTLWIPWSVLLLDYTLHGDVVKLKLGSGEFEVRFIGDLKRVEVGPDPEYGQNRVQAVLGLRSEGDEVGVNISSLRPLVSVMDSDLSICADVNLFRVVFKQGALVVCQTNP
jgi:hypothetical protein